MYSGLKIVSQTFRLIVPQGATRFAGGQAIPFTVGLPYWTGTAQLVSDEHADLAEAEMALMQLQRVGSSFEVFDNRFNGPRADPGGVILGDSAPSIHTIGNDNRSLRIAGLPAGYVLSVGDYLGISFGAGGASAALLRFSGRAVADAQGVTGLVGVEPFLPDGVAPSDTVTLVRPTCRAILVEAEIGSSQLLITEGPRFRWQEALL